MSQIIKAGLLGAAATVALVAGQAKAQDASGEIVVTAQKRSQSLQDVALSVSALGKDAAANVSTSGIESLATKLPSLQISDYSPTITIFNIRGVSQNDFADSQESPVAFYVDEIYVSAMGAISGQMFDLDRVEVLRGPQGTLFGRNATGGLVQAISAKPSKHTEGHAMVTVGSYGQVSGEAAFGGPISDTLRGRVQDGKAAFG